MNEIKLMSDEKLMCEYQQENMVAFEEIYRRYAEIIYFHLKRKMPHQNVLDDIVQTIFMKLHSSRFSYNKAFSFRPWIFKICKNTLIDHLRKTRNTKRILESLFFDQTNTSSLSRTNDFLTRVEELPENQRLVIEYRFSEDNSFEEIAKKLNISPANARQILCRALKNLKRAK